MDMKSFFEELLKQYGLYTTIVTMIVLYILKDLWNRFSPKLFKKSIPLTEHSAFKKFEMLIDNSLMNDFKCDCPIRKAIYRDILIERMKCFKTRLLEFVKTDLNSKDSYPTQHDFYLKVVSVIDDVSIEARQNSIANGVPEFVLDTLEQHRLQMKYLMDDMFKVICYSDYGYSSNDDRMREILSLVVVFCKNYVDELESVLDSFNGQIKNLNYKGIICKNCKVCIHDAYVKRMKATF